MILLNNEMLIFFSTPGYFHSQMEKASIPMRPSTDFSDTLAAPLASEIDELAERSESLEQRVASLNDSYETLKKREVELSEWRWVLREAGGFFDRVSIDHETDGG
jgi:V-type H+-transporting ATPase subunit a